MIRGDLDIIEKTKNLPRLSLKFYTHMKITLRGEYLQEISDRFIGSINSNGEKEIHFASHKMRMCMRSGSYAYAAHVIWNCHYLYRYSYQRQYL